MHGGNRIDAHRRTGYLLVAGAALFWSTNGLPSRLLFDAHALAPRQLAALRVYGSAVVLAPLVLRARPRLAARQWLTVAAFGVFGVSVPQWLYFESISRIPVPIALVIVYTAPAIVTAYERVVHHHRWPPAVYLAICIAIGGVVLAVTGGSGGKRSLAALGVVLAIATAFAYAGQIHVASVQPRHLHPLVGTGLGMMVGSLFWMVVSPPWRLPWSHARQAVGLGVRLGGTAPEWMLVVWVIVLGTVTPYTLLVAGTPRIGLGAASVTGMLEPVVASLWAWLILDQRLRPWQAVGVGVALVAVTVAELLRNRSLRPMATASLAEAGQPAGG